MFARLTGCPHTASVGRAGRVLPALGRFACAGLRWWGFRSYARILQSAPYACLPLARGMNLRAK